VKKLNNLNRSFNELLSAEETTLTYEGYYSALVSWLKSKEELKEEIEKGGNLAILLDLDPYQYIIEKPDILLNKEKERLGSRRYKSIENMLMSIGDTLWDLVTEYSEKDCPICVHGGLRYMMAENESTNGKELILECNTCVWSEHLNGREWTEGLAKVYPVNRKEIERYLAKIQSNS